ncbi:hypothetical protein BCR36DRAFT_582023 [Piromyces finnis]|uniref:CRESS-DNA virus Rep endonuclease domain-containing protein n=1 Tax=Piromyces finnis TaxID=1754191 RepID=A0A1Y1VDN3_9FUNG|nr:hypothetical protein BCR36DRAFT_582023 [Piromyces finnis]|eukprot:ORX53734.1 hypothetical protein BCR36DRAFT_582023 [Piromyces finnis]
MLENDLKRNNRKWNYIISIEKNHEGYINHYHIHAYIRCVKKLNTTDLSYFDVLGNHPNIQFHSNYRSSKAMIKCVLKEYNEPLSNFNYQDLIADKPKKRTKAPELQ